MFSQRQLISHSLSPPAIAVLLMVLTTLLTSFAMVMNKYMVMEDFPPAQIILWRSLFSSIPLIFLIHRQGGLSSLKTKQPLILSLRGFMGFACMMAYCYSLKELSIFSAESLLHLEPIFVFIMAALFLREKIHRSALLALGVALAGVMMIMNPGTDVASIGGLFAIAAAFFYATEIILTRLAGAQDTAITMFAYYSVVCLIGSSVITAIEGFVWPEPQAYVGFAFIAFLNLGINLAFTEALRRAPASQLAPLEYLTLGWVTLWQIQIWGELPGLEVVLGAIVILLSGLWILKRSLHMSTSQS